MTLVVDASIAAAWLLPDEGDEACLSVLGQVKASHGLAPSIFRHEVRNILLLSEKRRRITGTVVAALLVEFAELPIQDCGPGDDADVVALARTHGLTAYDAAYVALALSGGSPLATLDTAMAAAARACGLTLLGPLAP